MSSDVETETAAGAGVPPEGGEPHVQVHASAHTILFGLIVITALATWIIPAGRYVLDDQGSPIPGTYEEVESTPSRIVVDYRGT